jgi:hypothetical protein
MGRSNVMFWSVLTIIVLSIAALGPAPHKHTQTDL